MAGSGFLEALGYGPFFDAQLRAEERGALRVGRAVEDRGRRLVVRFEEGESLVTIPGRLRARGEEAPVVGDFVLAPPGDEPPIARVLARRTRLSRGVAGGRSDEQVLAANVDLVLLVHAVDAGVKPRRIERTLAAVHACGADPAVLLSKMDLLDLDEDRAAVLEEAQAAAGAAPVVAVSATTGDGVDAVRALLAHGRTAVFVGASGAGKSTLVNALVGEEVQATAEVRPRDARGRHRTTGRRLFVLETGGAVIDGPGIRELKLWDADGLDAAFDDVTAIAGGCRFGDCRHEDEPGCAVLAAVEDGRLEPTRLESLKKLRGEARAADARAQRKRGRVIARARRRFFADDGEPSGE
jgi:ribosome biogenesis GTPase / thiamine phosphate phosphatase